MITHRERLQACLRGELADRPPVALWRHFPVDDQSPETLSAAHLAFQQLYDFDLLKVTPASSYSVMDWGVEDAWEGNTEGTRRYTKHVIEKPGDWEGLRLLGAHSPSLDAQIACLRLIRQGVGADTPVLLTVFNALAQAKHLAGDATLMMHLRQYPEAVAAGLRTIAETTRGFIRAAAETGIDGVFFAVQHAQADLLSPDEFVSWSRDLDLDILGSASDLWCNILHLHGENVFFDQVADYPVQIINWHDRETPPTLREAREKYQGVLCGGLARDTLVLKTGDQVRLEARDAIAEAGSRRLLLSTGCVIPIITPHGNIMAARGAAAG
jgi:uroporphyrinogen decarboxylase